MELELITTGVLQTDCREFERQIEVTSMSTNFFLSYYVSSSRRNMLLKMSHVKGLAFLLKQIAENSWPQKKLAD